MIDFRTELRAASFRGIAFEIVDDDITSGRRIVTHEYPGRDEPYHEDMGASVYAFSIRAVVIGSGYVARADALEKAFLQKGPGTLIHPHYGEVQVIVKECRRQHNITSVGAVEFGVSVERYTTTGGISVVSDTARKLTSTSTAMYGLANSDFLGSLAQGLFPDFVSADGVSRLNGLLAQARDIFRNHGLGGFTDLPNITALNSDAADQVAVLFQGVISTARPLDVPIVGSSTVAPPINSPVTLMRALTKVADTNADADIASSTPSRAAIVTNASAISNLVKTHALAAAGGVARYATYVSREQAISTRDMMGDGLSSLRDRQLIAGQMPAFRATTDVMVAVTEDINERIGRLPRTVKVQSRDVRPSIALAHRLYGDDPSVIFSRADDIVKRNHISHPGFIGVKPLEVLLNV